MVRSRKQNAHAAGRTLSASNKDLRKQLDTLSTSYAVGERGDACMSIDGGNL